MLPIERWWRRALRRLLPEREWTILLVTDAETNCNNDDPLLTSRGFDQVTESARRIRLLLPQRAPAVWRAAPYRVHSVTADRLNAQLSDTNLVHDWSVGAGNAYPHEAANNDFTRLVWELERQSPDCPVVLVLIRDFGACLLKAARIDAHRGRAMRPDRVYPLVITSRGRVKLSPLLDLTTEAPELTQWPRVY